MEKSFDLSREEDKSSMTITSISPVRTAISDITSTDIVLTTPERVNVVATMPLPEQLAPYVSDLDWSVEERSPIQALGANMSDSFDKTLSNLGATAASVLKRITIDATDAFGSRSIAERRYGIAVDPLKEIFFNGISNRTYSFSWKFQPKNSTESKTLMDMIKELEAAIQPKKLDLGLFRIPDRFEIEFAEDLNLPSITSVVCTNISTDYSAAGSPRFFKDGNPAFVNLSLSFTEIEVRAEEESGQ